VQDNGVGFDVDQIDGNPKHGIGLRNMVERLEAVGGRLKVSSSAAGTTVLATIPHPHYSYV
jgi:two-component system NarL family sensor kinase